MYAMLYTGLWGSPPHVRGKVLVPAIKRFAQRITPAYAGKRSPPLFPLRSPEDHPRMCGKKLSCLLLQWCFLGSPPHVRGKVGRTLYLVAGERITPAYAGKSFLQRTAQCRCQDHPHVCGERLKRSRSTVSPVAIVPLFPSVCNKPVVSDGSPAGRDAPLFLPAENAVPASPAYNLRSL